MELSTDPLPPASFVSFGILQRQVFRRFVVFNAGCAAHCGRISLVCQMRPFWDGSDWKVAIIANQHRIYIQPLYLYPRRSELPKSQSCNAAHHAILDHGDSNIRSATPLNFTCSDGTWQLMRFWDQICYILLPFLRFVAMSGQ